MGVAGAPVVHTGGGSETDLAFTEDGGIVAVMRNEAGMRTAGAARSAPRPTDLARWTCTPDPKKYDSLVFSHKGRVWLIGRNLNDDGAYDLFQRDLSHADQTLSYQAAYWNTEKCRSLWEAPRDARRGARARLEPRRHLLRLGAPPRCRLLRRLQLQLSRRWARPRLVAGAAGGDPHLSAGADLPVSLPRRPGLARRKGFEAWGATGQPCRAAPS